MKALTLALYISLIAAALMLGAGIRELLIAAVVWVVFECGR